MKGLLGIDYFAQPEALLLLLLVPLYLFWYRRFYRRQRLVLRLSYDPDKLQQPKLRLTWLRTVPRTLQFTALVLLVLALARPQRSQPWTDSQDWGADIMVVMDVSRSMENKDLLPNRFTVAREAARALVDARPDDRLGLVVFGPTALHLTPLTFDHEFLNGVLERTNANALPGEGSALGPAIGLAINRLRDSEARTKAIVLLSDGGANGGNLDPLSAARLAGSMGIPIYCLGLSARSDGEQQNLGLLTEIAPRSGGNFRHITTRAPESSLWTEWMPEEPLLQQARTFRIPEDAYPVFLKAAIVLLAIAFALMLTSIYNPLEQ